MMRIVCSTVLCFALVALSGCEDQQSVLAPTGLEAERIAVLTWVVFAIGAAVLALVVVLALLALGRASTLRTWLGSNASVVLGGIVLPVVVLSGLLVYGLLLMTESSVDAPCVPPCEPQEFTIRVTGERWWWRVSYEARDGRRFETANEIHIPAGQPVEIELASDNVIHSFWVPKLAGKVDTIPGRMNRIRLHATVPGRSRGQCAEYCGGAHALMSFHVIALSPEAFDRWLDEAARPARPPSNPLEARGQQLFLSGGCAACHAVRGTGADAVIGPDLTHLASRPWLAAATLPNDRQGLEHWIVDNQRIKPDNLMPPFAIFDAGELDALTAYLGSLR